MKITVNYADLHKTLETALTVYADKQSLQGTETVLFIVDGNTCTVNTGTLDTFCTLEMPVVKVDGDGAFNVPVNELTRVLAGYNNLHTSDVQSVDFDADVEKGTVKLSITELMRTDDKDSIPETNTSYTRLTVKKLNAFQNEMLKALQEQKTDGYTEVSNDELGAYLKNLMPALNNGQQGDSVATRATFDDEYVYVPSVYYVLMLQNKLPEVLHGVCFKRGMVKFLSAYLKTGETAQIRVDKLSVVGNVVQVVVRTESGTALLRAYDTVRKFDVKPFTNMPSDGVYVSRAYFCDIMRRLSCFDENVVVTIDCTAGECTFVNSKTNQRMKAGYTNGNGVYKFELEPAKLNKVAMCTSPVSLFDENGNDSTGIWITAENNSTGTLNVGFYDKTYRWKTRITEIAAVDADGGNFSWN